MKFITLVVQVEPHTGEKPYQCYHCDKGFNSIQYPVGHLRTHTHAFIYILEHVYSLETT